LPQALVSEEALMFSVAAALVGIVGIFYVRRRFARKRQEAAIR